MWAEAWRKNGGTQQIFESEFVYYQVILGKSLFGSFIFMNQRKICKTLKLLAI